MILKIDWVFSYNSQLNQDARNHILSPACFGSRRAQENKVKSKTVTAVIESADASRARKARNHHGTECVTPYNIPETPTSE